MNRKTEKRLRLLRAASDVIARYGLKKTTMDDIAERAGMAKATIYHYFKSKEEVFSGVVRHESEVMLASIQEAVNKANTPEDKFAAFVKSRFRHLKDLKALYEITHDVAIELLPLAEVERRNFLEKEIIILKDILKQGIEAGVFVLDDHELFAATAMAGIHGMESTFFIYGLGDSVASGVEELIKVFLYGLVVR